MQNIAVARIAFFLYLLTAAHQVYGAADFTFTKIAENGTPMPGFAGNFGTYFEPTIDGGRVAFLGGHDSSNFRGVYLYTTVDGTLRVAVDNNTLFPATQDTFTQFGTDVAVSGDNVAFKVTRSLPTRRGVYLWESGVLSTIVDLDDAIPGGTGNFIDLHTQLSLSGTDAVFKANGATQDGTLQHGLYTSVMGSLYKAADRNTPVPGGTGNFWSFDDPTIDDDTVVFYGQERFSSGMQGLYSVSATGGAVTAIVDENTLVPDGSGTFTSLSDLVVSNGNLAFLGSGGNQSGLFTRVNGQLRLLAGSGINLPGSTDEFRFQSNSLSMDGENVAFVSVSIGTALPMGIYSNIGGKLVKVIDENDTLDGNTPTRFDLSRQALSGTRLVFKVNFPSDDLFRDNAAIYMATAVVDTAADVLLRNKISGAWRLFDIEDFAVSSHLGAAIFSGSNWKHQSNADFDGDGDVDVLIRRNDGVWRVFETEDGSVVKSSLMSLFQHLSWEFQGATDFDGDGDADILARKSDNGAWRIFEVENQQVVSSAGVGLFPNSLWEFQGAADYDGDGDGDVLLRRTDNGRWRIFRMQDGALVSSAPAGPLFIGASWAYQSSGDMDKDGVAEIVLRHTGTGEWRVFKMVNGMVAGVQALNLFTNLLWEHAQTGDFDADGDQDLLLRKSNDSRWRIFNIENRQNTGSTVPAIWQNLNFEVKDIAPSP